MKSAQLKDMKSTMIAFKITEMEFKRILEEDEGKGYADRELRDLEPGINNKLGDGLNSGIQSQNVSGDEDENEVIAEGVIKKASRFGK